MTLPCASVWAASMPLLNRLTVPYAVHAPGVAVGEHRGAGGQAPSAPEVLRPRACESRPPASAGKRGRVDIGRREARTTPPCPRRPTAPTTWMAKSATDQLLEGGNDAP
jgi:hypothetical protein